MAAIPNRLSRFWQELKRRKVIRTITVYAEKFFRKYSIEGGGIDFLNDYNKLLSTFSKRIENDLLEAVHKDDVGLVSHPPVLSSGGRPVAGRGAGYVGAVPPVVYVGAFTGVDLLGDCAETAFDVVDVRIPDVAERGPRLEGSIDIVNPPVGVIPFLPAKPPDMGKVDHVVAHPAVPFREVRRREVLGGAHERERLGDGRGQRTAAAEQELEQRPGPAVLQERDGLGRVFETEGCS